SVGMKGAVVVGDDYPTVEAGASTPVNPEHMGVPFQPHYVGIATFLAIAASIVFTFYLLKYGESAHTSGGNN
ncbi:MAG: halocyanin domain-containing protein, partial [Halorhabdus sp.]